MSVVRLSGEGGALWLHSPVALDQRLREDLEGLGQVRFVVPNFGGCEQCVAMDDTWVHLRVCMTSGQVGCCDSSKNRHAHKHADEAGHLIVRSKEPSEDWMWCYVDDALVRAEVP